MGVLAACHLEPDGTVTTLDRIHVRATEFTVGATGSDAMPAELPGTSAYTYAVELSVDEARAVGAHTVEFTREVSLFLDNFLDLPVGVPVPNGLYDRASAAWVAERNGVVAQRVAGGIDTDGDGVADDDEQLTALGHFPEGVRAATQKFFDEGDSFWLAAVPHFTPSDLNYPFEWPEGAVDPDVFVDIATTEEDPCEASGSTIECQNQVLGKVVELPGTNLDLTYRSDRVIGRGRGLELRLTGETLGPDIQYITIDIELAGRHFHERFDPAPNLTYEFEWDGLDAYGRAVNGRRSARVNVAYWYDVNYTWPPEDVDAFGALGDGELLQGRLVLPRRARFRGSMGGPDARDTFGLGGWQLSAQPGWDANSRTLYPAAAPERESSDVGMLVHNLDTFDDADAFDFDPRDPLIWPKLELRRDGTVLILFNMPTPQIWSRSPAGARSRLSDLSGVSTVGGVNFALHPNGDVFVAGRRCVYRLRDEIAVPLVGECADGSTVPPRFPANMQISIAPNGRVFVADFDDIFEVFPDEQRAAHFAGCGGCDRPPEIGESARDADLGGADLIAAGRDGIYFSSVDDESIRFVDWAGTFDVPYLGGDKEFGIKVLELNHDDELHFAELEGLNGMFIKRLQPDGAATVVGGSRDAVLGAGNLVEATEADGVPASSAFLGNIYGLGFDAGGTLYFSTRGPLANGDTAVPLIKVLSDSYYDIRSAADETLVPSEQGDLLHVFDRRGRVLRTVHALTRAPIYEFEYQDNVLTRVIDPDIGALTIERDADGNPTAITTMGGTRTTLDVGGDGHLERITYPDERIITMSTQDGLMTDWQFGNHETSYSFDAAGRLTRMEDGSGAWKQLVRTSSGVRYETSAGTVREWGPTSVRTRHGTDWRVESSPFTDALTSISTAGGTTTDVEFDELGRPIGASSPVHNVARVWNADTGRVERLSTDDTSIELAWDGFLLRSSRHLFGPADVTVERTRNNDFYLTRRSIGSVEVDLAYDHDGLLTSAGGMTIQRGDAWEVLETEIGMVRHTREYDEYGWPVAEQYMVGGTIVYAWEAEVDLGGRITSVAEELEGGSTTTTFTYDPIGRLTDVQTDGAPSEQYEWSGGSHRTLANGAASDFDAFGRLTLQGATSVEYDADGNVSTIDDGGATSWSYDAQGHASAASGSFGEIEFLHDALGKRVGMLRDGAFERGWIYDGDDLVAQVGADGAVDLVFVYAAHAVVPNVVISSNSSYRLLTDWRGSVRAVVDTSTGAVVQRRDYDAFGVPAAQTGADIQPFAYAGGLDVGLPSVWAFASRVYVPELARWLQPDPMGIAGGDIDLWAYAAGDPVNLIDVQGELLFGAATAMGVVAIGAVWAFRRVYPFAAQAADAAVQKFEARNGHRYPEGCLGAHNGPGDAVKHCTLSCELSREFPGKTARAAQHLNEVKTAVLSDGPIPWEENVMDHHNNACGNRAAEEQPDQPCYDSCEQAFFRGELFVLPASYWCKQ